MNYAGPAWSQDSQGNVRVVLSEGIPLIESGMAMVFETVPGERIDLLDFGSRLKFLVFEGLDNVFDIELIREGVEPLKEWEDRITVFDAIVERTDEQTDRHENYLTVRHSYTEGQERPLDYKHRLTA